jgi:dihydrofolate reductase
VAQEHEGNVMVIGGAQVYAAAMDHADLQVLTQLRIRPEGDTFYPAWDPGEWSELRREPHDTFDFVWLARAGRGPADR